MFVASLLIALGLALLVGGGEILLRGAVGLATLLRLTPAIIGLTVVAAGTSVPELAVSAAAAAQGSNDLAVANVLGSNILNITVIVGICALILPFPIQGNTLRLEYPAMAIVTLLCVVLIQDLEISRLDAFLLLAGYICFTGYMIRLVRKQMTAEEGRRLESETAELQPQPKPRILACTVFVTLGIILLAAGAQATVSGASQLARAWGWSERVIGLTIVSTGTSLPEVVASLVSSLRGRSDVAIGNVIGSNIFNLMVILGLTGLVHPVPVQSSLVNSDGWWMLGTTLVLLPIMLNGKCIHRWEGALLMVLYGIYLALLLVTP